MENQTAVTSTSKPNTRVKVVLKVTEGPEIGKIFEFTTTNNFLAGRSLHAHLRLDPKADPYISRNHFFLEIWPPRCRITDLGSTNGTFVNDERVTQKELSSGDIIKIGRTTIFFDIVQNTEPEPSQLICAICRRNVIDEVAGQNTEDLKYVVYICNRCKAKEDQERTLAMSRATGQYNCSVCQTDVSDLAVMDGRAEELKEVAKYLCPTCSGAMPAAPGDKPSAAPYRIMSKIGSGGIGQVYKAVHQATGRLVALKWIYPHVYKDTAGVKLFEQELAVQGRCVSPHLARFYDQGASPAGYYFASEFLSGGSTEGLVVDRYQGGLDPALATGIICQALKGLRDLHREGFLHLNLKPSNILLDRPLGEKGLTVKISDYGLAVPYEMAGNSTIYKEGEYPGTVLFRPPEQILKPQDVNEATDVYSMAVCLYYLLTGKYPVAYPSPLDLVQSAEEITPQRQPLEIVIDDPPIPILQHCPEMLDTLAAVVDKAVSKEIKKRYKSADELRDDLETSMGMESWRL
ncbi:MAG: protein kinase [Deltaproteobacteria bacterium]|nr:protein kinase [Deltaproteobacteria bacterium]